MFRFDSTPFSLIRPQLKNLLANFDPSGLFHPSENTRGDSTEPRRADKPYKAIVYVFLNGGADTFVSFHCHCVPLHSITHVPHGSIVLQKNLLVPHSGCVEKDLYIQYNITRGNLTIPKDALHLIDAADQPCETFGLHPNLAFLQQLYQDGDASFFANTGLLYEPSTKANYLTNHLGTRLFDHTQVKFVQKVRRNKDQSDTGVLGRLIGILSGKYDYLTSSTSTNSDASAILHGNPGSPSVSSLKAGFQPAFFDPSPSHPAMRSRIGFLNNANSSTSALLGEAWTSAISQALRDNDYLAKILPRARLTSSFPDTDIGNALKLIAQLIALRNQRNIERDIFTAMYNGFDTHKDLKEDTDILYSELNGALKAFSTEMKRKGMQARIFGFFCTRECISHHKNKPIQCQQQEFGIA